VVRASLVSRIVFLVPEVEDEELSEGVALEPHGLREDPRRLVLAGGDVEGHAPPGRGRQGGELAEELGGAAAQRDEGDAQVVEAAEVAVRRQPRVEDEVARIIAVVLLPERDELEDLLGLLPLAQIGVGVAEGPPLGVLREKGEHARLAAAARRDVMALHLRVLAVVGHGVEVEIERRPGEELLRCRLAVPGREELGRLGVVDAGGVLCEVALLRDHVEPAEEPQAFVGDQGHDVALALDRPELERERGPQGMPGGNHPRARQARRLGQGLDLEADQIGDEEK